MNKLASLKTTVHSVDNAIKEHADWAILTLTAAISSFFVCLFHEYEGQGWSADVG